MTEQKRLGIIRRRAPRPEGWMPGGEKTFSPELEELVDQAIIRTRTLGKEQGVWTSYAITESLGDTIGGRVVNQRITTVELPLKSTEHLYDASISTTQHMNSGLTGVSTDFDQLGNPVKTVHDRLDGLPKASYRGRLIYRRLKTPGENRPIRDLSDEEAIELMKDVLTAEPDKERILQLYQKRISQIASRSLSAESISLGLPNAS